MLEAAPPDEGGGGGSGRALMPFAKDADDADADADDDDSSSDDVSLAVALHVAACTSICDVCGRLAVEMCFRSLWNCTALA